MPIKDQDPVDQYPTLMLLLRLRALLPAAAALVVLLLGAWPALQLGQPYWAILGVVGGGAAFIGRRAALELLDLVTDLLVPR